MTDLFPMGAPGLTAAGADFPARPRVTGARETSALGEAFLALASGGVSTPYRQSAEAVIWSHRPAMPQTPDSDGTAVPAANAQVPLELSDLSIDLVPADAVAVEIASRLHPRPPVDTDGFPGSIAGGSGAAVVIGRSGALVPAPKSPMPDTAGLSLALSADATLTTKAVTIDVPAPQMTIGSEPPTPIGQPASIGQTTGVASSLPATPAAPPAAEQTTPARQVAEAILARPGERQIEIRLDPPDLGRVRIEFDFVRDGLVRAVVAAADADTLQLLRRQTPALLDELRSAGFDGVDLSFDSEPMAYGPDAGPKGERQTLTYAAIREDAEDGSRPHRSALPSSPILPDGIDIRL